VVAVVVVVDLVANKVVDTVAAAADSVGGGNRADRPATPVVVMATCLVSYIVLQHKTSSNKTR